VLAHEPKYSPISRYTPLSGEDYAHRILTRRVLQNEWWCSYVSPNRGLERFASLAGTMGPVAAPHLSWWGHHPVRAWLATDRWGRAGQRGPWRHVEALGPALALPATDQRLSRRAKIRFPKRHWTCNLPARLPRFDHQSAGASPARAPWVVQAWLRATDARLAWAGRGAKHDWVGPALTG
jgi:hypothetical protein